MRGHLAALLLLSGAAAATPPAAPAADAPPVAPAAVAPATEGTELLQALEAARLAVVGSIGGRRALDAHAWRADLAVESVLVGEGAPHVVPFAWEELASSRPPRFANGDRVLLVLEALEAGSLWRQRLPAPDELLTTRVVAQRGTAFLRSPSLGSVSALRHYLGLTPELREGPAGQRLLLELAAEGERPLALSAAKRLFAQTGDAALSADEAAVALRALARADADPGLAAALLRWVERRQPAGLAAALDRALDPPEHAPAPFVQARGMLGAGLAPEREAVLLASPSPAHRAAAARVAGPSEVGRLADRVRRDPDAEVRRAALGRLAQLEGPASLEVLLDAFDDEDAKVRHDAGLHAAAFGADAVPRLREVASRWPWPASETAVVALRHAGGPEAQAALVELADGHPDRRVRTLAAIALGRGIGHRD